MIITTICEDNFTCAARYLLHRYGQRCFWGPISIKHMRNVFVDSGHYDLLGCGPMHRLSKPQSRRHRPILLEESN